MVSGMPDKDRPNHMIRTKRAYDSASPADGTRFLVDHLWPRGIKKESLKINAWIRQASPSTTLRKWFAHDPARWAEFRRKYFAELNQEPEAWEPLLNAAREGDITLVYGARDTEHNNAVALQTYLERRLKAKQP